VHLADKPDGLVTAAHQQANRHKDLYCCDLDMHAAWGTAAVLAAGTAELRQAQQQPGLCCRMVPHVNPLL
jgi:hypothetical protein